MVDEGIAVFGAGLLFFPLRAFVHRMPFERGQIVQRVPLYLLAVVVFSLLHTSWNWGTRALIYPLVGFGAYHYGTMPLPYVMELPVDLILVTLVVAALHSSRRLEQARRREIDAAQLETGLARARLDNLRLRLQPHFLFNALNTVSAVMYEDPKRADEILDRLGELLRVSLEQDQVDELRLERELAILDAYLDVTRARFGARVTVDIDVPPELRDRLVPPLLLQPIVENAVRHGRAEREGHGSIRVTAREQDGRLQLEVWDDGDDSGSADGSGVGLAATRTRLELLHGEAAELIAGRHADGGFSVRISLPSRRAEPRS